jgi:energy-coupling factor transport system permease protein
VIRLPEPGGDDDQAVLRRTSPVLKLGLAATWLAGLIVTLDPRPPLVLTGFALVAAVALGSVRPARLARGLLPLWGAALLIALFNMLFSPLNGDPAQHELLSVGPFRVTDGAVTAGAAIGLRVIAIAATSVLFAQTTEPTALVDSLVQQARVPERFAYGALAAYQAVPRLSEVLLTLRQARRIRGLRWSWHPRVLVGLLVLSVRHADRLALAMDARGFGLAGRSRYREVRWRPVDLVVGLAALSVLGLALMASRL